MIRGVALRLARSGAFIILSLLVFGIVGWAYWAAAAQENDALLMVDIDWAGRHLCPIKRFPELSVPLSPSGNRPDEDELWRTRVQGYHTRFLEIQKAFVGSENERTQEIKYRELEFQSFKKNEGHYRVEVRRTIREMEMRHPLSIPSRWGLRSDRDPLIDAELGIPIVQSSCIVVYPEYAHGSARADVLKWYFSRGILPANSNRRPALTSRSTRTQPCATAAML